MIYLFENGTIVYDESILSEEEKSVAWKTKPIKEPEKRDGFYTVFKFDFNNREMWYEYHEIPNTPEEKIVKLETENIELKLALAEMAETQELQRLETQLALAELAEAMAGGVE